MIVTVKNENDMSFHEFFKKNQHDKKNRQKAKI